MVHDYQVQRFALPADHYEISGWKKGDNASDTVCVMFKGRPSKPDAELQMRAMPKSKPTESSSSSGLSINKNLDGPLIGRSSLIRGPNFKIDRLIDMEGSSATPQSFSTLRVRPDFTYAWGMDLPESLYGNTSIRDRIKAHVRSSPRQSADVESKKFVWKKMTEGKGQWMLVELTKSSVYGESGSNCAAAGDGDAIQAGHGEEAVATYTCHDRHVGPLVEGKEWRLKVAKDYGRNFDALVCLTLMTVQWIGEEDFRDVGGK